mmetsp:Transcript_63013/g.163532  ORF Transcript_63013/g.163532 Transcript_63013/m.163532 type:complete len:271 (+) Transcript_63013:495-1307(+)
MNSLQVTNLTEIADRKTGVLNNFCYNLAIGEVTQCSQQANKFYVCRIPAAIVTLLQSLQGRNYARNLALANFAHEDEKITLAEQCSIVCIKIRCHPHGVLETKRVMEVIQHGNYFSLAQCSRPINVVNLEGVHYSLEFALGKPLSVTKQPCDLLKGFETDEIRHVWTHLPKNLKGDMIHRLKTTPVQQLGKLVNVQQALALNVKMAELIVKFILTPRYASLHESDKTFQIKKAVLRDAASDFVHPSLRGKEETCRLQDARQHLMWYLPRS